MSGMTPFDKETGRMTDRASITGARINKITNAITELLHTNRELINERAALLDAIAIRTTAEHPAIEPEISPEEVAEQTILGGLGVDTATTEELNRMLRDEQTPAVVPLTAGTVSKGGQNPPSPSTERPPAPQESGRYDIYAT